MAKVFKEEQEQCSIISTYYAIEKNANLEPDQDLELKQKFLEVYPNMPDDWYSTFLNQAEAIKNKIGSNNWKYGGMMALKMAKGVIPDNKVSYIMSAIWNIFTLLKRKYLEIKKTVGILLMYL